MDAERVLPNPTRHKTLTPRAEEGGIAARWCEAYTIFPLFGEPLVALCPRSALGSLGDQGSSDRVQLSEWTRMQRVQISPSGSRTCSGRRTRCRNALVRQSVSAGHWESHTRRILVYRKGSGENGAGKEEAGKSGQEIKSMRPASLVVQALIFTLSITTSIPWEWQINASTGLTSRF